MRNIFLFSNKFKKWQFSIVFLISSFWRYIKLFFKRNSRIKTRKFHVSYDKWQFDKGFLIIEYDFKHVVTVEYLGIKKLYDAKPIILDIETIRGDYFVFIANGLFSKRTFKVNLSKTHSSNISNFLLSSIQVNAKISLDGIKEKLITKLNVHKINTGYKFRKPTLTLNKVGIVEKLNLPSFKTYNQNDFI